MTTLSDSLITALHQQFAKFVDKDILDASTLKVGDDIDVVLPWGSADGVQIDFEESLVTDGAMLSIGSWTISPESPGETGGRFAVVVDTDETGKAKRVVFFGPTLPRLGDSDEPIKKP